MKLVFPNGDHGQVLLNPGPNRIGSEAQCAAVLAIGKHQLHPPSREGRPPRRRPTYLSGTGGEKNPARRALSRPPASPTLWA